MQEGKKAQGPQKSDLESTIKEKVYPLLEQSMEKNWGISIPKIESDITDKLKSPQLEVYVPIGIGFEDAKKRFKAEFLRRELLLNQGNVSQLAKLLGIDRRSVHRVIKDLDIKVEELRSAKRSKLEHQQQFIDQTIRTTLDQYKELIQPQKMEKMYQNISSLSRNIAQLLPLPELGWKEATEEFEKQFLSRALEQHQWRINSTAKNLKIRAETLYRKIKKLQLQK